MREAAEGTPEPATGEDDAGLSVFIARVLGQLSLSAWLPAAFFTVVLGLLVQFRHQGSMELDTILDDLADKRWTLVILAVPVLVSFTLLTQAFSFEAIRLLEGYWRRRGVAAALRNLCIRYQFGHKRRLHKRRIRASHAAFLGARAKWLKENPTTIVDALERLAIEEDPGDLSSDQEAVLDLLKWWALSEPWLVAKVEHLQEAEKEYPIDSRILPTKLGNLIRATEDELTHAGTDLEGFALRRRGHVSARIQQQHDQFRVRLDMYSILTMVAALLTVLTPALLVGELDRSWYWWIAGLTALLALTSWTSYKAAIASARGYLTALRQMDQSAESDDF